MDAYHGEDKYSAYEAPSQGSISGFNTAA